MGKKKKQLNPADAERRKQRKKDLKRVHLNHLSLLTIHNYIHICLTMNDKYYI